jgi:hypothetical protein
MAKNQDVNQSAAEPDNFPLSLEEFCRRRSGSDSRVELIGAFEYTERVAGRLMDLSSNYTERFDQFCNQPA